MFECVWSVGLEDGSESSMAGSWDSPENWEFELAVSIEVAVGSSDVGLGLQDWGSDDWNGILWSSVVTCHILMELTDCTVQCYISVLLIHVRDACSSLIPQNNSVSLYEVRSLLEDLIYWQNLALGALDFSLSSQMIPALLIVVTRICFEQWLGSERKSL